MDFSLNADKYLKDALKNLDDWVMLENLVIKKYVKSLFPTKYLPEMDTTQVLDEEGAAWYLSHIWILRWLAELGRIDIATEGNLLASEMCNPREGA